MRLFLDANVVLAEVTPASSQIASGDLAEVGYVAGQDGGVVGEGDTGDFKIHRADAHALTAEVKKSFCGIAVPRKDGPVGKSFDLALELGVRNDLTLQVAVATDFSEPAAHLFFDGDDAKSDIRSGLFESGAKACGSRGAAFPLRKVVCIKKQQSLCCRFAAPDIPARAGRLLRNPDRS